MRESTRPVLLMDVDGVISLWDFEPNSRPAGTFASVDGMPHFLSAEAGRHLQALTAIYDLVWCTGWEEKANEYLEPALGLPGPFPCLSFDRHVHAGTTMPGHWKLGAVQAYVGDRAVAWVDDALNDACAVWARERTGPTLLVHTEPPTGLTAAHAAELQAWAATVTRSRPARLDA